MGKKGKKKVKPGGVVQSSAIAHTTAEVAEAAPGAGNLSVEDVCREILECARYGEAAELQQILNVSGADVNYIGAGGNTAIHLGAYGSVVPHAHSRPCRLLQSGPAYLKRCLGVCRSR